MGGLGAMQEMQRQHQRRSGINHGIQRLLQHGTQHRPLLPGCRSRPAQLIEMHHQKRQREQAGDPFAATGQCGQGGIAAAAELGTVAGPAVGDGFADRETHMQAGDPGQPDLKRPQPGTGVQGAGVGLEPLRRQHRRDQSAQMHQREQHQQQATQGSSGADDSGGQRDHSGPVGQRRNTSWWNGVVMVRLR